MRVFLQGDNLGGCYFCLFLHSTSSQPVLKSVAKNIAQSPAFQLCYLFKRFTHLPRQSETLQIEWSQVNLDTREIQLEPEQTKTSEARILPLPSVLVNMLAEVEPKEGRVFSGTNLRKEWMTACASCGLGTKIVEGKPYPFYKGLTLHDLRRSAVRNLRNAGVPENVAMKISGHKTRSVFERYNIVSTEDVRDAMRRVETASLAAGKTAPATVDAGTRKPVRSESLVRVASRRPRKSTQLVESK